MPAAMPRYRDDGGLVPLEGRLRIERGTTPSLRLQLAGLPAGATNVRFVLRATRGDSVLLTDTIAAAVTVAADSTLTATALRVLTRAEITTLAGDASYVSGELLVAAQFRQPSAGVDTEAAVRRWALDVQPGAWPTAEADDAPPPDPDGPASSAPPLAATLDWRFGESTARLLPSATDEPTQDSVNAVPLVVGPRRWTEVGRLVAGLTPDEWAPGGNGAVATTNATTAARPTGFLRDLNNPDVRVPAVRVSATSPASPVVWGTLRATQFDEPLADGTRRAYAVVQLGPCTLADHGRVVTLRVRGATGATATVPVTLSAGPRPRRWATGSIPLPAGQDSAIVTLEWGAGGVTGALDVLALALGAGAVPVPGPNPPTLAHPGLGLYGNEGGGYLAVHSDELTAAAWLLEGATVAPSTTPHPDPGLGVPVYDVTFAAGGRIGQEIPVSAFAGSGDAPATPPVVWVEAYVGVGAGPLVGQLQLVGGPSAGTTSAPMVPDPPVLGTGVARARLPWGLAGRGIAGVTAVRVWVQSPTVQTAALTRVSASATARAQLRGSNGPPQLVPFRTGAAPRASGALVLRFGGAGAALDTAATTLLGRARMLVAPSALTPTAPQETEEGQQHKWWDTGHVGGSGQACNAGHRVYADGRVTLFARLSDTETPGARTSMVEIPLAGGEALLAPGTRHTLAVEMQNGFLSAVIHNATRYTAASPGVTWTLSGTAPWQFAANLTAAADIDQALPGAVLLQGLAATRATGMTPADVAAWSAAVDAGVPWTTNETPGEIAPPAVPPTLAVPTVSAVAPTTATVGAAAPLVTVTGTGFAPGRTTFTVNGVGRASTVVDATTGTVQLDDDDVAQAGALVIRAVTSAPGGGTSVAAGTVTVGAAGGYAYSMTSDPTGALSEQAATAVYDAGTQRLRVAPTAGDPPIVYQPAYAAADVRVGVRARLSTSASQVQSIGPVARRVDDGSCYLVLATADSGSTVYKRLAGAYTAVATFPSVPGDVDILLELEVVGSTLRAYVDGAVQGLTATADNSVAAFLTDTSIAAAGTTGLIVSCAAGEPVPVSLLAAAAA